MSVSIPQFWMLLKQSNLLTAQRCRTLDNEFGRIDETDRQDNARSLAKWLVANNALSKHQATILLGGRSGPFHFGQYRVYDRVSPDALPATFRAVHRPSGHPVVLQFLTGRQAQDPQQWAALAGRLKSQCGEAHDHLHRSFEVVDLVTYKFVVGEELSGQSLQQRLRSSGVFPPEEACRLVRQAALALARLHQAGRAHGDVRSCRLWLDESGNLKLLRDPLSVVESIDLAQTGATDGLLARADYMAPEMARAGKAPDALTDIYALGCTLYELLSSRPPFPGGTVQQKLARHANDTIEPLEASGVPQAIAEVVTYMMAKTPSARYQQATIVAAQLSKFVAPTDQYAQRPAAATLAAFELAIRQKNQPQNDPVAAAPKIVIDGDRDMPSVGNAGPGIAPTTPTTARRTSAQSKKRKHLPLIATGVGALAMVALVVGFWLAFGNPNGQDNSQDDGDDLTRVERPVPNIEPPQREVPDNDPADDDPVDDDGGAGTDTASIVGRQVVVADDGQLLWASPTEGQSVLLDYVPTGAQIFMAIRPADMLADEEGRRVLESLGPSFSGLRESWEAAAGLKLQEVEQLIVSLHDNQGKMPRPCFVVRLREPLEQSELLSRWGSPAAIAQGDQKYFTARGWSFFVPEGAAGLFVMGDTGEIEDAMSLGGAPPPMRRELGRLLDASDDQRHFSVLFAPNYLFSDGRELFSGPRSKVLDPLSRFLGEGLQAGMLSMHFHGGFYVELRTVGSLDKDRRDLADELYVRLDQIPDEVEDYIVALDPHPYWKRLALRYPQMIRFLGANTRVGVESDQAVLNAVLPATAAHNIIFGGELIIAQAPGAGGPATPTEPSGPQNVEQVLASKMNLSFDQTSLEFAMRDIAADVNENFNLPFEFKIRIVGDDLKLDGITRNQQIRDFNQTDATVAEILTVLVMRANPVTTVKEPSEKDQKLLWVVQGDPDVPGRNLVLITTRQVSEQKKYALPERFQLK